MRTLYVGLTGQDVNDWEHFLLGQDPSYDGIVDGVFDLKTQKATIKFQKSVGFWGQSADGIVGPKTYAKAMERGFNPLSDDRDDKHSPNWPKRPDGAVPITPASRVALFGSFPYKPTPTAGNPEAIDITGDWESKNIVLANVPWLANVTGAPKSGNVQCHVKVKDQLESLFADWQSDGLVSLVKTWGGMFVPRFVRGSRTSLSNHSWGTAFDINVQWNSLGTQGALVGESGNVRELVEIAYLNGFYWGGWFTQRPDPMHFEAFKVI